MNPLDNYLEEFYFNPRGIEEHKIIYLKYHYYNYVNKILNCKFKNFRIGVNSNKDILFFYNTKNPNFEIIYNIKTIRYYKIIYKINKKYFLEEIYLDDFNELNYKLVSYKNNDKNCYQNLITCYQKCINCYKNCIMQMQ